MHVRFRLPGVGLVLAALMGGLCGVNGAAADRTKAADPILLLVMDPLAKELACACVKGYGQRDYRKLANHLGSVLQQRVAVEFTDDLAESLTLAKAGQGVMAVGEQALVEKATRGGSRRWRAVARLSDLEGVTTMMGLFVVRAGDAAKELKDVAGRSWFFGLSGTEENLAATTAAWRTAGVVSVAAPAKRGSYSEMALDLLDSQENPSPVAVVPGYALRLLEGCGSVKPGELHVIGRTPPWPFITVFFSDTMSSQQQAKIERALLELKNDEALLRAMESRDGFLPLTAAGSERPQAAVGLEWPDWRGPGRHGRVARLPARLPEKAKVVWRKACMDGGLAGLSVGDGKVILAERDFAEAHDVYRCLQADRGDLVWRAQFPARGKLDYGQSPRATPVIADGRAYLLGAFGELRCVTMDRGEVVWKRHLVTEFGATLPTWGMCATPLVLDDLLIVNPGAREASVVALDRGTGQTRWTTPGGPAAYAAFICAELGGRRQIVGYDRDSLGGWDPRTGVRLWRMEPPVKGDFNVPTPIVVDDALVVATENNGTRLFRFDPDGRIRSTPAGEFKDLSPDTATPVATRGRVFGADEGLHCLDVGKGLRSVWHWEVEGLGDYASLLADDERVLVMTLAGELILLDGQSDACTVVSRLRVFEDDVEVYVHPALVGTRLYARGGSSVVCVDLAMQ